jgi:hypothetical protein
MCNFLSGEVLWDGQKETVYTSSKSDSHTEIEAEFGLRNLSPAFAARMQKVEYSSTGEIWELDKYTLRLDDGVADWWTPEIAERVERKMRAARDERILKDGQFVEKIEGGTYLSISGSCRIGTVSGGHVRSYDTSRQEIGKELRAQEEK